MLRYFVLSSILTLSPVVYGGFGALAPLPSAIDFQGDSTADTASSNPLPIPIMSPIGEPRVRSTRGTISLAALTNKVVRIAASNKSCLQSNIPKRGPVSSAKGAYYGLVMTFARSFCRGSNDGVKQAMLNGKSGVLNGQYPYDVFEHFKVGGGSEENKLVSLYGILLNHMHQETGGKYWLGKDATNKCAGSCTSNTAEAGLCQTSNDVHDMVKGNARNAMKNLISYYSKNKSACMTDIFARGVKVFSGQAIVGSGEGAKFQKIMRGCPSLALEHCAISSRHAMPHYGPYRRKKSKILPACTSTFTRVASLIKSNRKHYCSAFGL